MNEQTCPHLGVIGPESKQISARDYPSFENCCFADFDRTGSRPSHGTLLLADQSTYCLSGGYHQCPRFQSRPLHTTDTQGNAAARSTPEDEDEYGFWETLQVPTSSIPLDSEYLSSRVDQPDVELDTSSYPDEIEDNDTHDSGLNSAWVLAGTTFVSVFLLGIGLALYLGWQLIVNSSNASAGSMTLAENLTNPNVANPNVANPNVAGKDITLINVGTEAEALYVVQTATPATNAADADVQNSVAQPPEESGAVAVPDVNPPNISELAVVSDSNSAQPPNGSVANASAELAHNNTAPNLDAQSNEEELQAPIQQNFPPAVTPTPIVVAFAENGTQGNQGLTEIVQPANVTAPGTNQQPTFIRSTPTPRPKPPEIPVIALDAVVPDASGSDDVGNIGEEATPTDTPEPTATWPPPLVFFSSVDKQLREGKCTKLTWDVQNVRAVYVASIGVDGKGEKEVCIKDKAKIFDLMVVLPDGATKLYTTTVEFEHPTPTPTATWTYTPLPVPTATWTPIPPTAEPTPTPTVVIDRGVRLETAQPQDVAPIACSAGTSCEIALLATNSGQGIDDIIIVLADRSQPAWPMLICRHDGVCSADRLIQTNVGPGNTAFITLRLNPPADAAGQNATYSLYAASQASNETVRSDMLILNLSVP